MPVTIAVDFDGTCVEHRYPRVGADVPGAVDTLLDLVSRGHRLILLTMRSDAERDPVLQVTTIAAAVNWFAARGIPLFGVNQNPEQSTWTTSAKVYANLYIDDAGLGCPLLLPQQLFLTDVPARPMVDWPQVRVLLQQRGLL